MERRPVKELVPRPDPRRSGFETHWPPPPEQVTRRLFPGLQSRDNNTACVPGRLCEITNVKVKARAYYMSLVFTHSLAHRRLGEDVNLRTSG